MRHGVKSYVEFHDKNEAFLLLCCNNYIIYFLTVLDTVVSVKIVCMVTILSFSP